MSPPKCNALKRGVQPDEAYSDEVSGGTPEMPSENGLAIVVDRQSFEEILQNRALRMAGVIA